MVIRYHLICIALLISVIGSSDQGTKNVRRSLGFSQSNETEKSDTFDCICRRSQGLKLSLYVGFKLFYYFSTKAWFRKN